MPHDILRDHENEINSNKERRDKDHASYLAIFSEIMKMR
jgi:hypothetical protein